MITTCTMNPSLDYYMEFDQALEGNTKNRSSLEYYEAGGKGINVSILLNNLQIPTRACGFVGGFTKDFYITLLQKYEYIQPNFTYINGHTRVNVKVMEPEKEIDLNAAGPYITHEDMENLKAKVARLDEGDYFVLAGVCPEYLINDVISMCKEAMDSGVKLCLDTNSEIVDSLIEFHPFLVRMTNEVNDIDSVIEETKSLYERGAKNVIGMHAETYEAVLACADGVYRGDIIQEEKIVNTVGASDSLVAGFLMNYLRSRDAVDSFKFGCCCRSATAYSKGLATREKIDSLYESIAIQKI